MLWIMDLRINLNDVDLWINPLTDYRENDEHGLFLFCLAIWIV